VVGRASGRYRSLPTSHAAGRQGRWPGTSASPSTTCASLSRRGTRRPTSADGAALGAISRSTRRASRRTSSTRRSSPIRAVVSSSTSDRAETARSCGPSVASTAPRSEPRSPSSRWTATPPTATSSASPFPNALDVADAFHLHRQPSYALAEVRRAAWSRLRRASGKAAGQVMKHARDGLARARDELVKDTSPRGLHQRQAVEAALAAAPSLAL